MHKNYKKAVKTVHNNVLKIHRNSLKRSQINPRTALKELHDLTDIMQNGNVLKIAHKNEISSLIGRFPGTSPTDTSPTDISPTRHIPDQTNAQRTFPRPGTSPTDTFPTRQIPDRYFPD